MKTKNVYLLKALVWVCVGSSMLFAGGSMSDKIDFVKGTTTQKVIVNTAEGKVELQRYKLGIHNKSNYILKDIKLKTNYKISCPKNELVAGESMDCSYDIKKDDMSNITLNGQFYSTKDISAISILNGDFEDSDSGWDINGDVDYDSITNKNGLSIILSPKSIISRYIQIYPDKLYKLSLDYLILDKEGSDSTITIRYLDKNKKVISDIKSYKLLQTKKGLNDFSSISLMLPKNHKAKYIQLKISASGEKIALDNRVL